MTAYRVDFLNKSGRVIASEAFTAVRNYDAAEVAAQLADAHRDTCCGYELWRGKSKVERHFPRKIMFKQTA